MFLWRSTGGLTSKQAEEVKEMALLDLQGMKLSAQGPELAALPPNSNFSICCPYNPRSSLSVCLCH